MTDVKYIEVCCEADRLIGKKMKDHQKMDGKLSSRGFLSLCAGRTVNLKKDQLAGPRGDISETWNMHLPLRLGSKVPCPLE